jgi:3-phenylpropionate/trans-cinnamate dioxygenase ferredoxin subunit
METMAEFVRVCNTSEIPDPGKRVFQVGESFVLVCRVGEGFYAIDDRCTHDDGPLGDGDLDGFAIVCPRHGARFDIRDGRVLAMPATRSTPAYEVKVEGDAVYIKVPA